MPSSHRSTEGQSLHHPHFCNPPQYIGKVNPIGALRKLSHIQHRLRFDGMGPCCPAWLHLSVQVAVHGPAMAPFLVDNGLSLEDGLCSIKGPLHHTIWSLAARSSWANRCWCHCSGILNGNKAYLLHNFNDVVACYRRCRAFFGATVIRQAKVAASKCLLAKGFSLGLR